MAHQTPEASGRGTDQLQLFYSPAYFQRRLKSMLYLSPFVIFAALLSFRDVAGLSIFEGTVFAEKQTVLGSHLLTLFLLPYWFYTGFQNWVCATGTLLPFLTAGEEGITVHRKNFYGDLLIEPKKISEIGIEERGNEKYLVIKRYVGTEINIRLADLSSSQSDIQKLLSKN